MPGGPDYPVDTSTRYTRERLAQLVALRAWDTVQGIIHTPEGDIRTWALGGGITAARRDLHTALAYLDLADINADEHVKDVRARLHRIEASVDRLEAGAAAQQELLDRVMNFLGVVVPAWHSLAEVHEGDEMGVALLSAAALGLTAEVVALQREPGFAHEEVVQIEPPAGTLVARGSTVRVQINFEG